MTNLNPNNFFNYKSEYEKNGYAIIENVFTEDECNQIKELHTLLYLFAICLPYVI